MTIQKVINSKLIIIYSFIDPFMSRTPLGNTPMSGFRIYGEDDGDISKTFGNTSKAIFGDSSYMKKDNRVSPMNKSYKLEEQQVDNGLTFAQAASTASNRQCPCCNQIIPPDRRNINWNYDKNLKMVSRALNQEGLSPSTVNFPNNQINDPTTPNPPSRNSAGTEESKNKNKRKRKNKGQVKKLEEEFNKNPHWTNEDVDKISRDLKLDRSQVYKWNWDQKKKLNILPSKVYVVSVPENYSQGGNSSTNKASGSKKVYVKSINDLLKLQSLDSLRIKK